MSASVGDSHLPTDPRQAVPQPRGKDAFSKVLIRATNWIGDAVMSLPAVRAIRARFPDAHISLLTRPWVADLYAGETSVDRVIPYSASPGFHDLAAKWRVAARLRAEHFDCAILLQNAFEAAALAKLAGIPEIIGYVRDGRGWLLTRAVRPPTPGQIPAHERFYYLEMLRRAGLIETLPEVDAIRLEGAGAYAAAGRQTFERLGLALPVIGVSPGAAYGSAKRWIPERFAETAARLAREHDASICLFGSAAERPLCDEISNRLGPRALNLAGQTSLRSFIEAAAACMLFLSNDSGAMHIASALGVPTVTVFGATNPLTTGPTGPLARIVQEPVACSPCLLRECPIDHRCMTAVPASRVVDSANELLVVHH
jgi:heptosyltransferase-2